RYSDFIVCLRRSSNALNSRDRFLQPFGGLRLRTGLLAESAYGIENLFEVSRRLPDNLGRIAHRLEDLSHFIAGRAAHLTKILRDQQMWGRCAKFGFIDRVQTLAEGKLVAHREI